MSKPTLTVDARLEDWREVRDAYDWTGVLVGNGASIAIWEGFRYRSLFELARATTSARPLSPADLAIFAALKTTNFERVLAALAEAESACAALGQDPAMIRERLTSVGEALAAAIRQVHIAPSRLKDSVVTELQAAIEPYWRVYTTNYDLLLYWASLHNGRAMLKDYFWSGESGSFDIADARPYPGTRTILFLHGALHLERLASGATRKLTKEGGKLLDQVGMSLEKGATPLVVTEGGPEEKLASIRRSDYLSFAYQQFSQHEGPLVVFGHRLGEVDDHLVRVMRLWSERVPMAISMRRGDPRGIVARKAQLHDRLQRDNLIFFDAATHPLGGVALRVPQESRVRA